MTSEHAFLRAIKDVPTDLDLRRIFADWLEDNGQPQRAELIRLQVERASLPRLEPSQVRPVFRRLLTREKELLNQYGEGWLGPWAGVGSFRWGLIHVRVVKPRRLQEVLDREGGEEALHWVESLGLRGKGKEVQPLLKGTWLRHLASLRVGSIGDAGAVALAASPHLALLTTLNLSWNLIGDTGAAALAASPHLGKLTSLDLSHNNIGAAGAAALATSPHLRKLTCLDLRGNEGIGYETTAQLERSYGRPAPSHPLDW